jgi:hypothetical protein
MTTVVTYQTTSGSQINICRACEKILQESRIWPKDQYGEEYASVSYGAHRGLCECDSHADNATAAAKFDD